MDQALRLGGRYAIRQVLGRGGMAEVHLADDLRLGRQVAVKTLRPGLADEPSYRARFLREMRSTASLSHPGIVAVYDTGEESVAGARLPYIVMEYIAGRPLSDLVHAGPAPTHRQALRMTAGILDALAHAHAHGIVHRDIKPANVMVCPDGTVRVMDFGIARPLGPQSVTLTQTAMVIGTSEYLSPEQARGEKVDARSDLYSTGCLLYELLTGRPPFTGDNPLSIAYRQVRDVPAPPSAHVPGLPPALDALVLKALAKDRAERYQSAEEMRAAVEHVLGGLDTATRPEAPTRLDTAARAAAQPTVGAPITPPATSRATLAVRTPPRSAGRGPGPRPVPPRRTARRLWTVTVTLSAVLAAFGLYAAAAPGTGRAAGRGTQATVPVPDLVGRTFSEAWAGARDDGLRLAWSGFGVCPAQGGTRPGPPVRRVCGQTPQPGSRVARGTRISVRLTALRQDP